MEEKISWFGHASMLLKSGGKNIYYIDPFKFENRAKEKADIIFITHAHSDHCSSEDVSKILKPSTKIFASQGCHEVLGREVILTEPNKSYMHEGLKFETIPAYNTHPQRTAHPRSNNWVGYILELGGKRVYHAGDTDFIPEMKNLKNIDIAMLPMGNKYTMDVNEAILAANQIKAKVTIPIHYKLLLGDKYKEAEQQLKKGVKGEVRILKEVQ